MIPEDLFPPESSRLGSAATGTESMLPGKVNHSAGIVSFFTLPGVGYTITQSNLPLHY